MTRPTPEQVERLERYLDGSLAPAEAGAFEAEAAADVDLARELDLARRIETSLSGQFAYSAPHAGGDSGAAGSESRSPSALRQRWLAVAAGLMLVAAGWIAWSTRAPVTPPPESVATQATPEEVFAFYKDGGFKPEFACTTDAEFTQLFTDRFATAMVLDRRANTELVGWAYGMGGRRPILTRYTLVMLSRVEGKEVLNFVDFAQNDRPLKADPSSGLHVFRRVMDQIVVYEVSEFDHPVILDRLTDTSIPCDN